MLVHTCTSCHRRQLIFPSQITGLDNTDHGIVVTFTCWCDAEQTILTGKAAQRPTGRPTERPAAPQPTAA